jgi:hypothetical protein
MGQDLREIFKTMEEGSGTLKKGHAKRFMERMEKELPPAKRRPRPFSWKIAVSILALVAAGGYLLQKGAAPNPEGTPVVEKEGPSVTADGISLGDLSPDLRKVENYYLANINLALSELEVSEANKAVVDGFMAQLAELDREYKKLNGELNTLGPNDRTITALIRNLQLRLQLLQKLKDKVNELKKFNHEEITNSI